MLVFSEYHFNTIESFDLKFSSSGSCKNIDTNIGQGYKTAERSCTRLSALLELDAMEGLPSI